MSVFTRERQSKSPLRPFPSHLPLSVLAPTHTKAPGGGRRDGSERNCSVKQRSAPVLGFSCKSHVGIFLHVYSFTLHVSTHYTLQYRILVTVQVYNFVDNFGWLVTKMDILFKKEEEDNITSKCFLLWVILVV